MLPNKKQKTILRQPKVFQLPREKNEIYGIKNFWPRLILFLILFFLIFGFFIYGLFFSPWFKIKNIEIVGSTTEDIKGKLQDLVGKNIFSFHANEIEEGLASEDRSFSNVKIFRGLPDTVRVVFENRAPKIIWQSLGKNYLIDADAILYKEADETELDSLPKVLDSNNLSVKIPSQIATPDFTDFVQNANDALKRVQIQIDHFEVSETTFQISAIVKNEVVDAQSVRIIFNTLRPLSEQIDAFNKVYSQNKGDIKDYIDLRVEGRVYYK